MEEKKERRPVYTICFLLIASLLLLSSVMPANTSAYSEYTPLPELDGLYVNSTITENYAVTEVVEKVSNPHSESLWVSFSLKVPNGMFISNFTMFADNRTYYGIVVPRDVGENEFEGAAKNGTDAALLSLSEDGRFDYSLSMSAHQSMELRIRYEGYIEKRLGGYEYKVPFSGMYMPKADEMHTTVTISSSDGISSVSVRNYDGASVVNNGEYAIVTYGAYNFQPSVDMHVIYETDAPPVNGTLLAYDGYFMHIFSPQVGYLGRALPKDIIFVLDRSGSMSGTKIEQLKEAFSTIIGELPEQDRFNIIVFNDEIQQYSPSLLPATEDNRNIAVRYINSITAEGTTNINAAMLTALHMFNYSEERLPVIVMLTDGLPTEGVTNTGAIRSNVLDANEAEVSIFTLGFGNDVDFDFLTAMAFENNGVAVKIAVNEDASEQITGFYDTISTPLLKDIMISYSDNVHDIYPTYVRQMFSGTEVLIVGKYSGKSITSNISATTWSGNMSFAQEFPVSTDENHSFIPRLWAYAVINDLMDRIAVDGETPELVDNITALAIEYGFVTPYTSMLIKVQGDDSGDDNEQNDKNYYDDGQRDLIPNPDGSMRGNTPSDEQAPDDSGSGSNSTGYEQVPMFLISIMAVFTLLVIRRRKAL